MNIVVPGWALLLLSMITSFIIGAGTPLLTALAILNGDAIPMVVWIIAATSGFLVASRDVRALLSLPPVDVQRPPETEGGK
jgi:hypothetical protein